MLEPLIARDSASSVYGPEGGSACPGLAAKDCRAVPVSGYQPPATRAASSFRPLRFILALILVPAVLACAACQKQQPPAAGIGGELLNKGATASAARSAAATSAEAAASSPTQQPPNGCPPPRKVINLLTEGPISTTKCPVWLIPVHGLPPPNFRPENWSAAADTPAPKSSDGTPAKAGGPENPLQPTGPASGPGAGNNQRGDGSDSDRGKPQNESGPAASGGH